MNSATTPAPVAVIGAGWAGLTAALVLARAGKPVHLIEAGAVPGGRARSLSLGGGELDNGQHVLIGACKNSLDQIPLGRRGPRPGLSRAPVWPENVRARNAVPCADPSVWSHARPACPISRRLCTGHCPRRTLASPAGDPGCRAYAPSSADHRSDRARVVARSSTAERAHPAAVGATVPGGHEHPRPRRLRMPVSECAATGAQPRSPTLPDCCFPPVPWGPSSRNPLCANSITVMPASTWAAASHGSNATQGIAPDPIACMIARVGQPGAGGIILATTPGCGAGTASRRSGVACNLAGSAGAGDAQYLHRLPSLCPAPGFAPTAIGTAGPARPMADSTASLRRTALAGGGDLGGR